MGVQGMFWRSFNKAAANAQAEQAYAQRMPSTVHYTITFTDEYGDEHVTSLLSVEYKTVCKDNKCITVPDYTKQPLQEHAEAVNQSLGKLPRGAIENKYVWTVSTTYDDAGAVTTHDLTAFGGTDKDKWRTYPKDFTKAAKVWTSQVPLTLRSTVFACSSKSRTLACK